VSLTGDQSLASLDGEIMPAAEAMIPATDDGLIRGDGVFEVVRVYDGRPFAFEEHLRRLERSATNLRLPLDLEAVRSEANRLLAHAGAGPDHATLRVVLTRGGRRLMLTEPLAPASERVRLSSITYAPTRILDGVKSLSYAANMLCSRIARERGFDEALLVTPHGRVLEAPTSSLFWVDSDGALCTTPLSEHVLASITRAHLMELLTVEERTITAEQLLEVPEAFIASTTREVHSVVAIEDRDLGETGEVTRKAAAAFRAYVESRLA
jgi:branched-subunit amino acid aminotransferase/4-amino-4-deoxychorismate lyase